MGIILSVNFHKMNMSKFDIFFFTAEVKLEKTAPQMGSNFSSTYYFVSLHQVT